MSSEPIISLRNVSKTYRVYQHPLHGLVSRIIGGKLERHKEFHALNGICLDIHKGETVGIIGRNGSGKSTLLQLICGIRKPTSGKIVVNGRVSALLELGAGFHPEFTGRENVFMQGAIMGFTQGDMADRLDEIAAFADIGEFIDQPVKTYSSGMFVRLAFAVAISVEPDILVVDEALSVGDLGFQQKCIERIREMQNAGVTIFLVSHDIMLMRNFGDTLIYLDQGKIKEIGHPETVGEAYIRDTTLRSLATSEPELHDQHKDGIGPNSIGQVKVSNDGITVFIHVTAHLTPDITHPEIVVQLRDPRGYILYGRHAIGGNIVISPGAECLQEARAILALDTDRLAGDYGISVSLNRLDANGSPTVLDKQVGIATFQIRPPYNAGFHGCVNLGGQWLHEMSAKDTSREGNIL